MSFHCQHILHSSLQSALTVPLSTARLRASLFAQTALTLKAHEVQWQMLLTVVGGGKIL